MDLLASLQTHLLSWRRATKKGQFFFAPFLILGVVPCVAIPAYAAVNIPITVNLSEAVNVTGTPRIAVDVGGTTRYATYTSGTGTNTLTFTLSPQAGDVDLDGVTVSSPIDLNGGTMSDTKGNALSSLAFTPPTTTNVKVNYPSLGMDFIYDADGRYTLNGTAYNDLPSFLTAAGGSFTRASIGTYYDSTGTLQTAASGIPRFDYDPVTHAAKGILIEEARTNLLPQSQIDSLWVSGGTTPPTVSNSQTYLGIPCVAITFTSANTSTGYTGSRATRTGTGAPVASITTGTQYASSMFISASRALTGGESIGVYFTGSNGLGTTYLNSSTSSAYVGKWLRSAMTPVTAIATGSVYPTIFLNTVVSSPVTIYLSRGQVEVGAFSTSYIPTGVSTVTRQTDILTVPTTGGWFNTTAGTFLGQFEEASALSTGGSSRIMGTSLSGRFAYRVNGAAYFQIYDGTNIVNAVTQTLNSNTRISSSYGPAGLRISSNGTTPGTGPFSGTWGDQGYAWIASNYTGHISKYKFYPNQVTTSQLQLLSQ